MNQSDPTAGLAKTDRSSSEIQVLLIDPRQMLRECLAAEIRRAGFAGSVSSFGGLDEYRTAAPAAGRTTLVAVATPSAADDAGALVGALRREVGADFVVALCPGLPDEAMIAALKAGAHAVTPGDVSLTVLLSIIQLVLAGGSYAPTAALRALEREGAAPASAAPQSATRDGRLTLTPRQAAVVEALRRGKPNKLIAYELNMCESTVKVHLRTLMKKTRARSRTHLATMLAPPPALDMAV